MKIAAVYGSPRRGKISKTYWLLDAFLAGCREEGAEVKLINLNEYNIKFCTGCYTCWTKTPGKCALKDDMPEIIEILKEADLEVWAFPMYFFGPTALFKNFLDRTMILAEPFFELKDGICTHPMRYEEKSKDKIIISVCGFPEMDHFKPIHEWLKFMEGRGLLHIKAEIYRPAAEFLVAPPFKAKKEEILAAMKEAGREYVREGAIREETMRIIQQDFIDQETFIQEGNRYWQWEIDRWRAKREEE
ncbi:NADPH-dependent FMN reductase [Thermosyntropha lipolytica DSM 11003]|uniref:NADPH-dependent FMN reductase n=1 Tax=Thermosyntropha lipolytica DSM 11003 TaxID=1123382 RepID=A0A1M5S3R7_9FIRM|nr:flavodoxin family protein [Thermosyntropha lipolytica]SHH33080.1 NADPH-dependent FMN reductase [Thermosyntropha lipolytica DSM 11003]